MKKILRRSLFSIILLLVLLPSLSGCFKEESTPVTVTRPDPPAVDKSEAPDPIETEVPVISETELPVVNEIKPPAGTIAPGLPQPEPPPSSYSWYFQRNNLHQVPFVAESTCRLLEDNNAFYYRESSGSQIYLTFDEGYELGYTGQILDILQANDVKAIFFITGHYINSQPELVIRMKQEGHLVGNHTVNHPDLGIADLDTITAEITGLENKFTALTGLPMDKYMRPPMGLYSESSLAATANLGYHTVFWSLAFHDWDPNEQPGADFSYQHVMDNVHPGAVILLHAVSQSNTEALDRIIKDLQAAGYEFSLFP